MAYPTTTLADLRSADEAVRLKAAKRFESEMRDTFRNEKKKLFGNKKTTTILIGMLADPNPRIVHHAVVSLAEIARKYYQDARAYEPVLKHVRSKHPLTQRWVFAAAINVRGEDSLDDILPFCRDRSPEAREMSLYFLFSWLAEKRAGKISPAALDRLRKAALHALKDSEVRVRSTAAYLLREAGDAKSIAALQSSLKKEKKRDAKDSMKHALEILKERFEEE